LKPSCTPTNLELCDEEGKAAIEALQALSEEELTTQIEAAEKEIADPSATFDSEVEKLQAAYEKLSAEKDATIAKVKKSGLGLKKSVLAAKAATEAVNEEL